MQIDPTLTAAQALLSGVTSAAIYAAARAAPSDGTALKLLTLADKVEILEQCARDDAARIERRKRAEAADRAIA